MKNTQNMRENKMQWLINAVKENKMSNLIANTNAKKGAIIIPTGGGKSGVVYENIIYHILNMREDEKIIFNLSAPILDLEAQFINDLFDCLKEVFNDKVKNGVFMFFINSTADGDSYCAEAMYSDVNRFWDIDKFKHNPDAKVAFVASCHKSLTKFAEKIDYLNEFSTVISYLDESHLLLHDTRDEKSEDQLNVEERQKWDNLTEIFSKCDYVYTLTATEEKHITELLNRYAGFEAIHHIIEVPARELIAKNIILPIQVFTRRTSSKPGVDKINSDLCIDFMRFVQELNPNINHKMLITCSDTDHLLRLESVLNDKGYKVFSTCSREGTKSNDENEFETIDKIKFIKEIDNYAGDCFVLHIKRLRQGIDIKSLTDCIYYNSTRVNEGVKRTIIQTLGRILRTGDGERGVDIEHRTKKYGNALFVIGDDDFETVERQMVSAILGYYGRDGINVFSNDIHKDHGNTGKNKGKFTIGDGGFGNEYEDFIDMVINDLKANIAEYTRVKLLATFNFLKRHTKDLSIDAFVDAKMADLNAKFMGIDKEIEVGELISNTELMAYVSKILRDCVE